MEIQFEKHPLTCLKCVLSESQNMEQTQEIRIGSDMPTVGRVICSWGQPILRSREWRDNHIGISAGLMVWVLYEGEDGSQLQCVDGWIPFSFSWELPDNSPEGEFSVSCATRFVDARSVSAGKLMVRAAMSACVQAHCPEQEEITQPAGEAGPVQFLRSEYPVRLGKEAGEKHFTVEESLTLPSSAPIPGKITAYRMEPAVTDSRVLGGRLAFRGCGNLRVVYLSEEGRLCTWEFELPFSQFAELGEEHSSDAAAQIRMMPTSMELILDDQGAFQLKAGIAAQYLITHQQMISLAEDAACPGRELEIQSRELFLPEILDSTMETISAGASVGARADSVVDTVLLMECPRQSRMGDMVSLQISGQVQVLYYDGENRLQCACAGWEGEKELKLHEDAKLYGVPENRSGIQIMPAPDRMELRFQVPVQIMSVGGQGIPMITGAEAGAAIKPDPDRPSLILCRMGPERLWDLAKRHGASVSDIWEANDLQEEPERGRLLLIPVR